MTEIGYCNRDFASLWPACCVRPASCPLIDYPNLAIRHRTWRENGKALSRGGGTRLRMKVGKVQRDQKSTEKEAPAMA